MFWSTQTKLKGLTPAIGASPNFVLPQKVLSDSNNSECESYAVRGYCIYAAYKMSRHFPELLSELEEHLDMMQYRPLSPGLKSALRQTKSKISKLKI